MIGHGEVEGPFTELDDLAIERDHALPDPRDRAVLQGDRERPGERADWPPIRKRIDRVYEDADYTGSLVVDGRVGRPTEHDGPSRAAGLVAGLRAAPQRRRYCARR